MIRIEQFDVFGYQHLSGVYEFRPGLNVVTGPNESGKSTLHEALTVGLFGFSCEDRRRSGGVSPKDLRRPWSGAPFGGVLTVIDGGGRRLRVHWDFESDLVEVTDCATGEVILREQPQQRTDYGVGHRLLGLSREDHRQLSCLFQVGLEPVRPSETLRQSLQRAVEATAADGGVETADARLQGAAVRPGRPCRPLRRDRKRPPRADRGRGAHARGSVWSRRRRTGAGSRSSRGNACASNATSRTPTNGSSPTGRRRCSPRPRGWPTTTPARCSSSARPASDATAAPALPADLDGRVAAARDGCATAERGARRRPGSQRPRPRPSWPRRARPPAERTRTAPRSPRTPTSTRRTRRPCGPSWAASGPPPRPSRRRPPRRRATRCSSASASSARSRRP